MHFNKLNFFHWREKLKSFAFLIVIKKVGKLDE